MRYVNPAYQQNHFQSAARSLDETAVLVTVTHPYEVVPSGTAHPLLSFSLKTLEQNISWMTQGNREFITVGELRSRYEPDPKLCDVDNRQLAGVI
jgi:hypothetical protein